jgi:hypothetical protein
MGLLGVTYQYRTKYNMGVPHTPLTTPPLNIARN